MSSRPTIRLHRFWMVMNPNGTKDYVCAANPAKVVEIVEAEYGQPPGSLHVEVMEVAQGDLPQGATWLR